MNPIGKWLGLLCALGVASPLFGQPGPLTITSGSPLPNATLQVAYNQTLTATGGFPPYNWSLNPDLGTIAPGLSVSPNGAVTGTPTAAGTYTFGIDVHDQRQQSSTKRFSLTVQVPPLMITNGSPLPTGTVAVAYSYVMNATGGAPPYTWGLASGNLPAGLSLS